jgi:hypothetical protein
MILSIKREQSQTGLSFAERIKFRPQVKLTKLWMLAAILICGETEKANRKIRYETDKIMDVRRHPYLRHNDGVLLFGHKEERGSQRD